LLDLFDVSNETVWLYGNKLEEMTKSSNLSNIRFIQLGDVLGHEHGIWTKEYTAAHTPCIRRELIYRYAKPTSIPSSTGGDDSVRDYIDRMLSPGEAERRHDLAAALHTRGNAYASAIESNKAEFVHLSSHDFGAARGTNPLTISLLPQNISSKPAAPWHSTILVHSDGSYRASTAGELRNDQTCELIYDATGMPSHYCTKNEIWDWKADGLDVTFEHLYPTGTIIRPRFSHTESAPSIQTLPMRKVRLLSQRFSPIVLRGFTETTNEEYFLTRGNELGEIMSWTFGQILKVKDSGEVDKDANNVTSNEAMPMHFDGIFKFVDKVDPETGIVKKVLSPPGYQYFTCLSTAQKGDGYTLFANSRLFFQYLPSPFSLPRFEKATWSMVNDGFWSAKQTELPLVVRHKETGEACLRWHEPWTNTKFSKYFIEIENDEEGPQMIDVINRLLYDYRVCLRFEWEQGDLLINDNVSMLHTRTAFAGNCEREMWRIHFD
jgi:alpha-ketoglutarate-dependent taurine dioxygenase